MALYYIRQDIVDECMAQAGTTVEAGYTNRVTYETTTKTLSVEISDGVNTIEQSTYAVSNQIAPQITTMAIDIKRQLDELSGMDDWLGDPVEPEPAPEEPAVPTQGEALT